MRYAIKYNNSDEYIEVKDVGEFEHGGKKQVVTIHLLDGQELPISDAGFKVYHVEERVERVQDSAEDVQSTEDGLVVQEITYHEETVLDYHEHMDCSEYTIFYKQDDETVVYTNDDTVFGRYYVYNPDNGFVELIATTTEDDLKLHNHNTYVCTKEGIAADVCEEPQESSIDDEGYYKYKVVDSKVVDADEKVKPEDIYGYPDKYAAYSETEILEDALTQAYDVIEQQNKDIEDLTNAVIELYEHINQ